MLLTNVFSDMFDDMLYGMPRMTSGAAHQANGLMHCDVKEYGDRYELEMDLAGFKKGDIQAELKDGYLTVKAERHHEDSEKDGEGRLVRSERFTGTCQRSFYVGEQVQKEDVAAAYEDGVLKLSIPKQVEHPQIEESHTIAIA